MLASSRCKGFRKQFLAANRSFEEARLVLFRLKTCWQSLLERQIVSVELQTIPSYLCKASLHTRSAVEAFAEIEIRR